MVSRQSGGGDARIEAVVSNHVEASLGETALVLQHVVQVLQMKLTDQYQISQQWTIGGGEREGVWCSSKLLPHTHWWSREGLSTYFVMSPTQQDIVQPTVRPVHSILGRVHRVLGVWVVLERLRVNDLVRELAPHDESVSNDVPLALGSKEEQEFSQIVNEPGNLHPFGLSILPNGLRSLQQVLNLRNGRLKKQEGAVRSKLRSDHKSPATIVKEQVR